MPANSVRCRRPLDVHPAHPSSLCRTARASAWSRGCRKLSTDDAGGPQPSPAPGVKDVELPRPSAHAPAVPSAAQSAGAPRRSAGCWQCTGSMAIRYNRRARAEVA